VGLYYGQQVDQDSKAIDESGYKERRIMIDGLFGCLGVVYALFALCEQAFNPPIMYEQAEKTKIHEADYLI
jgi:hypothetical protein